MYINHYFDELNLRVTANEWDSSYSYRGLNVKYIDSNQKWPEPDQLVYGQSWNCTLTDKMGPLWQAPSWWWTQWWRPENGSPWRPNYLVGRWIPTGLVNCFFPSFAHKNKKKNPRHETEEKKTHQRALIYLQKMAGANSHFILGKKNLHIFSLKNGAYLCFSN